MKKVLFLLLVTSISYGQALFDKGIKVTGGITTDNTALKVVVQSSNNVLNTITKNDLIDVVIVNTTAELTSGIGNTSKLYATRDNTIIYRYNGTIYVPLGSDISAKEDIANKQNSLAVDGSNTFYPTVTAVNTGLALKANLASPTFTGTPTLPTGTIATTQTAGNSTTAIATTAFATTALNLKANLASPTLTGVPLAPTATAGTNTTQIATTAFVTGADAGNVKLTGNQTKTGVLSFTNTGTSQINGINTTNNGTGNSSMGILSNNLSSGVGVYVGNSLNGIGLLLNTVAATTGNSIVGQNNGVNTFTVDKLGNTTATSFINSTAPATNALLANGTTLAVAPLTGGTGYIQNQNASAQSANMWISGTIKSSNGYFINNNPSGGGQLEITNLNQGMTGKTVSTIFNLSDSVGNIKNSGVIEVSPNSINIADGANMIFYTRKGDVAPTESFRITNTGPSIFSSSVTATDYKISALNTAPASATSTGTLGEIRITTGFVYVCTATNTWVRTALTTW